MKIRNFLPNREEMLECLLKVSDEQYLQEHLYPLWQKRAGWEYPNPCTFVAHFLTHILLFIQKCPEDTGNFIYEHIPQFMGALIANQDALPEATLFLGKALSIADS